MDKDEALRIALEALVDFGWHIENCPQFPTWAEPKKHPPCTCGYDTAITALRQALEQPKREWVGLTDEEIQDFGYEAEKFDKSNSEWFDRFGFARAIEAKLKEKNT